MTNLLDYRNNLDNLLATAIDNATWTPLIQDQALRHALDRLNEAITYESSFTVSTTGYSQDVSSVTDLDDVLDIAWPWSSGADWHSLNTPWRYVDDQTIYFEDVQPQQNDVIRLRHTKLHHIENLDSAASTTVPARLESALTSLAGAFCLEIRARQIAENPALSDHALSSYDRLANLWRHFYTMRIARYQRRQSPAWQRIGLDPSRS